MSFWHTTAVVSFDRVLCMIGVHIITHSTVATRRPNVPISGTKNVFLCARAIVVLYKSQSTLQGWPASGHALAGWPRVQSGVMHASDLMDDFLQI